MRCIYAGLISILIASCGGSDNSSSDVTLTEVNSTVTPLGAGDVNEQQSSDSETNAPQASDSQSTTSQILTNPDSTASDLQQDELTDSDNAQVSNSPTTADQTTTNHVTAESDQQQDARPPSNSSMQFPQLCAGNIASSNYLITSTECDPQWRVCGIDDGIGNSSSWQTVDLNFYNGNASHAGRICIKACPSDENFIPDPSFPGLGWDNLNSNACAVVGTTPAYTAAPVPLYLPDNAPLAESFATPLAYYLYAGDTTWNCAVQNRQLSHDHFTDTGTYIDLQFSSTGMLRHKLDTDSQWSEGNWGFDAFTGHKVLSVSGQSESFTPSGAYNSNSIIGNYRVNQNKLEIYNTTVDRLSCTASREVEIAAGFPESIDEIESAPVVTLDELRNMNLECEAFQQTSIHPQSASFGAGHEIEDSSEIASRTITNVRAVEVDESLRYQDRYALDNSETNYSYNEGSFSQRNLSLNDVSRSPFEHLITFRRTAGSIIMTENNHSGGGSGNSGTYTYTLSMCQSL